MFDKQSPPDEAVFELLASPRRILLLDRLLERDGEAHLEELSRDIVVHETDAVPQELDSAELKSAYVSLYQTHVPALEECGVVEYDAAERVVSLGDRAEEVVEPLQDRHERRRRWAVSYLLVGLVLGGFALARASGLIPVPVSVVATATVVAALLLPVLATVHYYRIRGPRFDEYSLDDW